MQGGRVSGQKWLNMDQAKKIFPLYDTNEVIMPMDLNDEITSIEHLKNVLVECPNMSSFVALIRIENPYITKENVEALYSLLKAGKDGLAEKLLRPFKKPNASYQLREELPR
jgi:hypothetical protein